MTVSARVLSRTMRGTIAADTVGVMMGGANDTKACAICGSDVGGQAARYPRVLCEGCAARATDDLGGPPVHDAPDDTGTNPVFVGRHRCWRRYKFGGFVTMFDAWESTSASDFMRLAMAEPVDRWMCEPAFIDRLSNPPSAAILGRETDEVAHNHAIDFILRSSVALRFIRSLACRIAAVPAVRASHDHTAWEHLANAVAVQPRHQPRVEAGRGDEFVTIETPGGPVELVIEMKVEADEDPGQLTKYLSAERASHPDKRPVVGWQLVVGHRSTTWESEHVASGADELVAALAEVVDARTEPGVSRVANDYRDSVEYLVLRDRLVVETDVADRLRLKLLTEPLKAWAEREWRWLHKRLAREVCRSLQQRAWESIGRISVNHDGRGSAIDLWPRHQSPLDGRGGLFLKWRLGSGFEVHAYGGTDVVRAARLRLRPLLDAEMTLTGTALKYSNRRGHTGMIARVPDPSLQLEHVAAVAVALAERVLASVRTSG